LTIRERKAFFINLYNILVIHGYVTLGPPTSMIHRQNFFSRTFYNIGGFSYSLNDIEHGILRGNKKSPSSIFKQFSEDDPRLKSMDPEPDPRIHFDLVCGAKSCPPIRIYHEHNVEIGLQKAAENFCEYNVDIDVQHQKIRLSKIFFWYQTDFAEDLPQLLDWISKFLSAEKRQEFEQVLSQKFTVDYLQYNWNSNQH